MRLVLAIIVVACVFNAQAQTPDAGKRAAIQELLNLMGATQFARMNFITLVDQYSQALANDSIQSFEKKNWSPEVREKMETLTRDFHKRLSQRLSDELLLRIGYEERLNRLYLETYDEHFSVAEVRELFAFYKSPIGQKFIGFVPKVAISLQQKAQAEVEAPMTTITREIVDEELKLLEKRVATQLNPPTPRKKN